MVEVAAWTAAALLIGVALFQVALAAGAPWGAMAYGGRIVGHGPVLPTPYRIMSGVAVVMLSVAAWVVLARADVAESSFGGGVARIGAWVVFGYLAINTVMNLAAKHRFERFVMGSVTATAAAACLIVALSSS